VDVALDPAPRVVLGSDQPGARLREPTLQAAGTLGDADQQRDREQPQRADS